MLRGRLAEHHEDGHAGPERINQGQRRPERNRADDEAARGDRFDRAAREAANDVRRKDKSAE
jgi:hypothetical protein